MFKFSLILVSLLLVVSAAASPILDLCGTGLAVDCQTLATYALFATDLHYQLVAVPPNGPGPNAVTGPAYLTQDGPFPLNGPWMANGPSSAWIAPTAHQGDNVQGSDLTNNLHYVYETTFNLPANFGSAVINGLWAADNSGIAILLNGHNIGSTFAYGPPYGFAYFTGFTATSGFQVGLNTLEFVVANGNGGSDTAGPSGLRVQITDATFTGVPEPATFGLLLFGLPVAWFLNRKRA